jgi:hypothetical protein
MPWERQPDEAEEQWWAWVAWVWGGILEGSRDTPEDLHLAARFRWAERAAATLERLSRNRPTMSKAAFAAGLNELRDRILTSLRADTREHWEIKDLAAIMMLIAQTCGPAAATEIDVDRLDMSEARALRDLLAKARKAG